MAEKIVTFKGELYGFDHATRSWRVLDLKGNKAKYGKVAPREQQIRWGSPDVNGDKNVVLSEKQEKELEKQQNDQIKRQHEAAGTTGIPFMITLDMKRRLTEMGFTLEQIAHLTPEKANNILNNVDKLAAERASRKKSTLPNIKFPTEVEFEKHPLNPDGTQRKPGSLGIKEGLPKVPIAPFSDQKHPLSPDPLFKKQGPTKIGPGTPSKPTVTANHHRPVRVHGKIPQGATPPTSPLGIANHIGSGGFGGPGGNFAGGFGGVSGRIPPSIRKRVQPTGTSFRKALSQEIEYRLSFLRQGLSAGGIAGALTGSKAIGNIVQFLRDGTFLGQRRYRGKKGPGILGGLTPKLFGGNLSDKSNDLLSTIAENTYTTNMLLGVLVARLIKNNRTKDLDKLLNKLGVPKHLVPSAGPGNVGGAPGSSGSGGGLSSFAPSNIITDLGKKALEAVGIYSLIDGVKNLFTSAGTGLLTAGKSIISFLVTRIPTLVIAGMSGVIFKDIKDAFSSGGTFAHKMAVLFHDRSVPGQTERPGVEDFVNKVEDFYLKNLAPGGTIDQAGLKLVDDLKDSAKTALNSLTHGSKQAWLTTRELASKALELTAAGTYNVLKGITNTNIPVNIGGVKTNVEPFKFLDPAGKKIEQTILQHPDSLAFRQERLEDEKSFIYQRAQKNLQNKISSGYDPYKLSSEEFTKKLEGPGKARPSQDANTLAVGFGHDLTSQEKKTGKLTLPDGTTVDFSNNDILTLPKMDQLFSQDYNSSFNNALANLEKAGIDTSKLTDNEKKAIGDLAYNAGPNISSYAPKFTEALRIGDKEKAFYELGTTAVKVKGQNLPNAGLVARATERQHIFRSDPLTQLSAVQIPTGDITTKVARSFEDKKDSKTPLIVNNFPAQQSTIVSGGEGFGSLGVSADVRPSENTLLRVQDASAYSSLV